MRSSARERPEQPRQLGEAESDGVDQPIPRVTRSEKWALASITAALLAVVAFWAVLTPSFDAPDEPTHFNSAVRLADGGGWPEPGQAQISNAVLAIQGQVAIDPADRSTLAELRETHPGYSGLDQMTQHPPAYYAYVAAVLKAIDYDQVRSDHAVLAARLAGLLFVLPLPLAAWDSVRRLTRSRRAGLMAAASLLAVPQLAHIMGSVSNDSMAIGFSSLVLWLGVRLMTGDRSWWTTVGMGAALAGALLSKGTTLPMVVYVAVVALFWPRGLRLGQRAVRAFVALAVGFIGGVWWARNLLVLGTLQPNSTLYPTKPWADGTGPSMLDFTEYVWTRVIRSFWGNFGWLSNPMPQVVTDTLTVVCLAVVVAFAYRRSTARVPVLVLTGITAVLFAAFLVRTWSGYVRTQLPAGLQGRYFFVVIVALIAISAVGWRRLVPVGERTKACYLLLASTVAVAALGIFIEVRYEYSGIPNVVFRSPLGARGFGALGLVTAALCVTALVMLVRQVRVASIAADGRVVADDPTVEDGARSEVVEDSAVHAVLADPADGAAEGDAADSGDDAEPSPDADVDRDASRPGGVTGA